MPFQPQLWFLKSKWKPASNKQPHIAKQIRDTVIKKNDDSQKSNRITKSDHYFHYLVTNKTTKIIKILHNQKALLAIKWNQTLPMILFPCQMRQNASWPCSRADLLQQRRNSPRSKKAISGDRPRGLTGKRPFLIRSARGWAKEHILQNLR